MASPGKKYQVYLNLRQPGYFMESYNVLWTVSKKRPPILLPELENPIGKCAAD